LQEEAEQREVERLENLKIEKKKSMRDKKSKSFKSESKSPESIKRKNGNTVSIKSKQEKDSAPKINLIRPPTGEAGYTMEVAS